MKKLMTLFTVLFLVLAGPVPGVMAQSGEKQEQAEQQPDQTVQTNEGEAESQPAADISDTFTPSEEISEDLSVSFPVDI